VDYSAGPGNIFGGKKLFEKSLLITTLDKVNYYKGTFLQGSQLEFGLNQVHIYIKRLDNFYEK
jgi:hypothetical protein